MLLAAPVKAQPAAGEAASSTPPAAPSSAAVEPLAESLTGDAKAAYDAGKVLYGDGDFAGAVIKFQQAYELAGDPRLLWNVLVCEKNLRHYARVEALLGTYLKAAGPGLADADRAEAEGLLAAIAPFIASVTLSVNQPDATVFVDGQEVARSPLAAPLRVDMGSRQLRVTKPGFKPFELTRVFAGGTENTVNVTLAPETHEGRLRVAAGAGASIKVDARLVGIGEWEGRLASGLHSVEVSARGKETFHADSAVRDDQLTTVLVSLKDAPAAGVQLPTWVWVAGGSVLAAGLGTGAYFLFKPADKGPPPPTAGSLATWELPLGR